jgi:hypothetical protein
MSVNQHFPVQYILRNHARSLRKGSNNPNIKLLEIKLGQIIEETLRNTWNKTDMKAVKRRIMATAPATDILHRAKLINRSLSPIKPCLRSTDRTREGCGPALQRITTIPIVKNCQFRDNPEKKTLILEKTLSLPYKGGLEIQHPKDIAAGLKINLVQKLYKKRELIGTLLMKGTNAHHMWETLPA